MTETARTPLVRPRFLKWSLAIFVILVPFVAHAALDFYESHRFSTTLAGIHGRGEPISAFTSRDVLDLKGEAADASRYYRAAAALAQSRRGENAQTAAMDEALRLLDVATPLRFIGFSPGTAYSYQFAELNQLAMLARKRTERLLASPEPEQAGAALYAQLRLLRPIVAAWRAIPLDRVVGDVADVLSRARLDDESLERIQAAVRELDREDMLGAVLLRERASMLDMFRHRPPGFLARPFQLHYVNDRLEVIGRLLDGTSRPWPERINVPRTAFYPRAWRGVASLRPRDEQQFLSFARELANIRCALVAIAVARYSQSHGTMPARVEDLAPTYFPTVPVDPFSGKAIEIARDGEGYRVHSVGTYRSGSAIEIRVARR